MSLMKTSRRQNFRRRWQDVKWPLLLALAILSLVLGYMGFARYAASQGESPSPLDLLYQTLQLISMNSGSVPGPINWQLQVARFLIPALTVYTALSALALIFSQQIQVFKLWSIKDHVVICGLGRKGALLVEQFRAQDYDVAVLEQNEGNDWLQISRALGAVVLTGDATDPEALRQARVDKAKVLIAVMGDDGANAEVAVRAEEIVQKRSSGVLTCLSHIVDPQLYDLLREKELGEQDRSSYRLEFFNIYDRGARLLLQAFADRDMQLQRNHPPKNVLVVGVGKLGESLILHSIKQWHESSPENGERLKITVIDREATWKADSLRVRYPQLEEVCDLVPLQIEVNSPQYLRADFLHDSDGGQGVERVYICLDDDSFGLHAGLSLLQQMKSRQAPIIIRMVEDSGLAALLAENRTHTGSFVNLHAFGLLNQTCTADLILGGTHELLARDLHSVYLSDHILSDELSTADEALVPWTELPERLKESNRRQTDSIVKTLTLGGYVINPLRDWNAGGLEFSSQDVEGMARIEHERWCQERKQDGWVYGEEKDAEKKTHPDLVFWDDLPPEEKDKNRAFIRGIPKTLARAGFQVERRS